MKKIRILHIAEIDNDKTKGTSSVIPQYIYFQKNNPLLEVYFLNCNNIKLDFFDEDETVMNLSDNVNMNAINKIKPELVVFHELYKPCYLKIYKYLCKKRIPFIIIPHGGMTKIAQKNKCIKKFLGNLIFFNNFFKSASKIQYLSEKERINTKFPKLDYFILGNGVDNIPLENLYLKEYKNRKTINFIYIGRYDYIIKGLDQLLDAFRIINKTHKNKCKLIMYGNGDEKNIGILKKYISDNKLENIVEMNGPIFGDKKRKKILSQDVFIQVSRTEGQPLGVMEALALGMPVLLSEGTGFKEIIKENNIGFCTKTDAQDIYFNIIKFLDNRKKMHKYSINSYQYACENYSWDNIVKKSINTYKDIIGKRGV